MGVLRKISLKELTMTKTPLISLLCLTVLSACASSQLTVESQPEGADVVAKFRDSSVRKIGQTPLSIPESQLPHGDDSYEITIAKDKFEKENIVITPSKFSRNVKVNVKLNNAQETIPSITTKDLNEAIRMTALAQNALKSRDFDLAEKTLNGALLKHPNIPTIYTLLGNTFYLRKDLDRALMNYKKAFELDPQNLETESMIKKIESIRGNSGSL